MCSASPMRGKARTTIGVRITLLGAAITLTGCLLMAVLLYVGLSWSLYREIDSFLAGEIAEVSALLREHAHDYAAAETTLRSELGYRASPDLVLRLLNEDGDILVASDIDREEWSVNLPKRTATGAATEQLFETVHLPDRAAPIRLCSRLFEAQDGRRYIAQAGYVLDGVTASLTAFRRICLAGLALMTLASIWAARGLARGILQPIHAMTTTARRISARALSDRLPYANTHDELDQLAATLNEMLNRIQRHVTQQRQFLADASHELRTPLAALRGKAEVALSRERSAAELQGVVEGFLDQFDRLSRVAEDLLLLARAEAGQLPLEEADVQVDAAVADVLDLYEPSAADAGIRLCCDRCDAARVRGDAGRLRQLIGNLVDNAIRYGGRGAEVRVALQAEGGVARLTVRDTGMGIPPEHLVRVFDRFYRVDESRSSGRARGGGLGLSICRTIAEAHRGRITLSSNREEGTIAVVTLPLAVEARP